MRSGKGKWRKGKGERLHWDGRKRQKSKEDLVRIEARRKKRNVRKGREEAGWAVEGRKQKSKEEQYVEAKRVSGGKERRREMLGRLKGNEVKKPVRTKIDRYLAARRKGKGRKERGGRAKERGR